MVEPLVELQSVTRNYGARVALEDANFMLEPGQILGIVGPNGSGKTTLLKLIAGLLRPSSGNLRVLGVSPFENQALVMRDARFAFAPPALFEELNAREHLRILPGLGAQSTSEPTESDIDRVLEMVGLRERDRDRVREYSLGMKQRLMLAQAMLPTPRLLVLDEPTEGLDPLAVLELREVLTRLREVSGTAILLSSHLLVEIEQLVDQMLVLYEGKTLFQGGPSELSTQEQSIRLVTDQPDVAVGILEESSGGRAQLVGSEIELPNNGLTLEAARTKLRESGVELLEFRIERPTLESALLERLRAQRREDA